MPDPANFPVLTLKVAKIELKFGPKQYFWYYPGFGLYLAVKQSDPGLGQSLSEN